MKTMVLHGFSWFFIFMLPDQCFLCPCFLFPVSRSLCYVSCGYVSCWLLSVSCFLFPRLLFPVLRFPVSCLRRLRFPFSSSSESKSPTMEDEKVYFLRSAIIRWRAIEKDHILESDLFRWRAVEKDNILKKWSFNSEILFACLTLEGHYFSFFSCLSSCTSSSSFSMSSVASAISFDESIFLS